MAKNLLLYHLHRLGIDRMFTISNNYEMARTLVEAYDIRKTMELLGFISFRDIYGQDSLKMIPKSTYDRKMAYFKALVLSPVFSDVDLPPLDLSPLVA